MDDKKIYSDSVMQNLRQQLGLEDPYDTSRDEEIMHMSKLSAFEGCLVWEGIIGYGRIIIGFLQDIYGITFEDID